MEDKRFANFSSLAFIISVLLSISACTPEQEIIDESPGEFIAFSSDTIFFDTLFTSVGSITKRLRVFNPNKQAIKIPEINLAGGASSPYNMYVNGDEGFSFNDVVVFGKDSLLILVEVTIDPQSQDLPFLVKDSINFRQGNARQDIKLISWGQDANFLNNVILGCDETWTAERPYVIVNAVLVDSLCHLTLEKGTRVFFNNNASLFVKGQIEIRGDTADQVILSSVRQDGIFENSSGQWNGIFFLEGSEGNIIDNAVISNGQVGLRIGSPDDNILPDVIVSNTIIKNMSQAGILAFTSDVFAYNSLIYNCGTYLVGNFAGGNYSYVHCTFTNQPNDFRRNDASVQFSDNIILADNSVLSDELHLELINSIIWGNMEDEFLVSLEDPTTSSLLIQNNILRSTLEAFDTNDNIIGQETNFPGFSSPFQTKYSIDSLSIARDAGVQIGIEIDIRGFLRDEKPDIGAYEWKDSN
ncbi:MAG: right-handed parallel beta-helix repeat-containing protein [Bacteroidetes bacterium]|nr:right-handed parallel beta-helix repeat-containing protein [Bacteroidota bacterium]MDA1119571.1 right-handed parallel beta-helix repeat-containing protein [Bacteroidota bacterium]